MRTDGRTNIFCIRAQEIPLTLQLKTLFVYNPYIRISFKNTPLDIFL